MAFLVAAFISFIGWLPPGLLNTKILDLSAQGQRRRAVGYTLGLLPAELLYAWVAWHMAMALHSIQVYKPYIQAFMVLAFVAYGGYWLRKALMNHISPVPSSRFELESGILQGFTLSLFNPMLITFWTTMIEWAAMQGIVSSAATIDISFLIGIAAGSLGYFLILIVVTKYIKDIYEKYRKSIYLATGIGFVVAGLWLGISLGAA